MAVPETFRFVLVALVAMVAYRFVNEFGGGDEMSKAGNRTDSDEGAVGHAVEEQEGEAVSAPKKKAGKGGGGAAVRQHKLKKSEVLIEYCTS